MKCLTHNIEVNYPCSSACPLYGDCIASFSREVKRRVRTNADHIRAMSDEELAEQLVVAVNGLQPCTLYYSIPTERTFLTEAEAVRVTLEWLQQPAEEDERWTTTS